MNPIFLLVYCVIYLVFPLELDCAKAQINDGYGQTNRTQSDLLYWSIVAVGGCASVGLVGMMVHQLTRKKKETNLLKTYNLDELKKAAMNHGPSIVPSKSLSEHNINEIGPRTSQKKNSV